MYTKQKSLSLKESPDNHEEFYDYTTLNIGILITLNTNLDYRFKKMRCRLIREI